MHYVRCDLGVNTADAEQVAVRFEGDELRLSFVDWQERPCSLIFRGVLAFRWQELDDPALPNDAIYEAVESSWLEQQAGLQSVPPQNFSHYLLCFNACGALDILAGEVLPGPKD